ncbi:MAG: glycerol-3-phosphate acyltransferase [Clostridiales bacterium]|nr:glycerol-3-phosphate acyltransferase [Clostridiales bacterium]
MNQMILFLVLTALVSYCLGGINGAIITSVNYFKKDVRNFGSGNAGLTNFSRTFGEEHVLLVLFVDVVKTIIAVWFGGWLMGRLGLADIGKLFAGFCTILGHIYPPYYSFRGGKGSLCSCALAFMVDWRLGLIGIIIFLVVVIFTKYVSLGSIIAVLSLPVVLWSLGFTGLEGLLGLFCATVVIFAHRENIKRLLNGTESKLSIGSKGRNK